MDYETPPGIGDVPIAAVPVESSNAFGLTGYDLAVLTLRLAAIYFVFEGLPSIIIIVIALFYGPPTGYQRTQELVTITLRLGDLSLACLQTDRPQDRHPSQTIPTPADASVPSVAGGRIFGRRRAFDRLGISLDDRQHVCAAQRRSLGPRNLLVYSRIRRDTPRRRTFLSGQRTGDLLASTSRSSNPNRSIVI